MNKLFQAKSWVWLLALLPVLFVLKPFQGDDAVFLGIGERLPFTLFGGEPGSVYFDGYHFEALTPYESTHPPLIPYLLKCIGVLVPEQSFGFGIYHGFFLIFPLLIAWWGLKLTRDLELNPWWTGLLLLAPSLFVNATNLMTDVALTAFCVGAIAYLVELDLKSARGSGLGLVMCCLAAMVTAYQAMALPVILATYGIYRRNVRLLLPLGISFGLYLIYLIIIYLQTGFFPFLAHTVDLNIEGLVEMGHHWANMRHKLTAIMVHLGFALCPGLIILWQSKAKFRVQLLSVCLGFTIVWFETTGREAWMASYGPGHLFLMKLLFFGGLFWTTSLCLQVPELLRIKTAEPTLVAARRLALLWFACVLGYNLLLMPYINSRYLLPALPAALILLPRDESRYRIAFAVVLGLLISLVAARADWVRARADYQLYQEIQAMEIPPQQLWYSDDHGLGFYLAKYGAQYMTKDLNSLPKGSYVLLSRPGLNDKLAPTLVEVERFRYGAPMSLVLHQPGSGAGFYASHDGILPFSLWPTTREAVLLRVP